MLRGKNGNKGFTLIELILVIVILGILAAVAIPRFVDLRGDARAARDEGALAAFRGAVTLLHAEYLIHSTEYDATALNANTNIQGGSTGVSGSEITVTWDDGSSKLYSLTRTPGSTIAGSVDMAP